MARRFFYKKYPPPSRDLGLLKIISFFRSTSHASSTETFWLLFGSSRLLYIFFSLIPFFPLDSSTYSNYLSTKAPSKELELRHYFAYKSSLQFLFGLLHMFHLTTNTYFASTIVLTRACCSCNVIGMSCFLILMRLAVPICIHHHVAVRTNYSLCKFLLAY